MTLTTADIDAAAGCRPFCDVLAQIADPPKCGVCKGDGKIERLAYDSASGAMEWDGFDKCSLCHGTGHAPTPSLVESCLVWSDQLEEWGDSRAEVVRPELTKSVTLPAHASGVAHWTTVIGPMVWHYLPGKNIGMMASESDIARRLLLLFREPCERCKGAGKTEVSGWLDLPMPIFTRGEPVAVPPEVAVCKRQGCGGPLYLLCNEWDEQGWMIPNDRHSAKGCILVECVKNTKRNNWSGCMSPAYINWQPVHDRVYQWARRRVRRIG